MNNRVPLLACPAVFCGGISRQFRTAGQARSGTLQPAECETVTVPGGVPGDWVRWLRTDAATDTNGTLHLINNVGRFSLQAFNCDGLF